MKSRFLPKTLMDVVLLSWESASLRDFTLAERVGLLYRAHGLMRWLLRCIYSAVHDYRFVLVTPAMTKAHTWLRLLVEDLLSTDGFEKLRQHYTCPITYLGQNSGVIWERDILIPHERFHYEVAELHAQNGHPRCPDAEPFKTGFSRIKKKTDKHLTWSRDRLNDIHAAIEIKAELEEREGPDSSQSADHITDMISPREIEEILKDSYKCRDKLRIPGTRRKGRNIIGVNEKELEIGDRLFILMLRLAVELKKGKNGWVARHRLSEEHVTPVEGYQIYSELRQRVAPCLLEGEAPIDFIENDREQSYRLSVPPDNVVYLKEGLLRHPDKTVKRLTRKLP